MAIVTEYIIKQPDNRGIRHWVRFQYNKEFVEKVKSIPSIYRSFDSFNKMWGFNDRGWNLFCAISEVQFLGNLLAGSEDIGYKPRKTSNKLEDIDWEKFRIPATDLEPELYPFDFQKVSISRIIREKGCGLLYEVGLGKSYTAVCTAKELVDRGEVDQVVIISLVGGIIKQWAKLLDRMKLSYTLIGSDDKMVDRPEKFSKATTPFVLTLYTTVLSSGPVGRAKNRKFSTVFDKKAEKGHRMALIADELHKLGDVESKTYREFNMMAKRAKYRIPLTGTIIKSTPEKALLPLRFIAPNIFNNKGVFEEAFVVKESGKFGPKTIGYKNLDRLKELIHTYGCVELKKDHLKDLPELLPPEIITVETDKDSLTVLKSIRSGETFKAIQNHRGQIPYADLQDLYIRVHQALICPHLFSDKFLAKNMLEATLSILEDVEGKTIVFTTLIDAVEEISGFLSSKGVKNVACSGRYKEKVILERVERFVTDQNCNVMVATVQLMGTGFDDLKVAQNCIIYDFNLIAGDLIQAIGRIYRNGQKNKISVFELVQDNPFSQYQFEKVRIQQNIINQTEDVKIQSNDSVDLTGLIKLALESNLFGSK